MYNIVTLKLQQNSWLDFPGHICYFNAVLKVGTFKDSTTAENHSWDFIAEHTVPEPDL